MELEMWVVTDHPKDFPNHYVARKNVVAHGGNIIKLDGPGNLIIMENLEELRQILASKGLSKMLRDESDDPVIVESWM
jgi:hypothetical protein